MVYNYFKTTENGIYNERRSIMEYNEYEYQKKANILALYEDAIYAKRKEVLEKLVKSFQKEKVDWALSCSSQLFLNGLLDDFHDFDILIGGKTIRKMKKALREIGAESYDIGDQTHFSSNMFMRYKLDEIHIDLISSFRIVVFDTVYCCEYYDFEPEMVEVYGGVKLPVVPMEANYLLYGMMECWQPQQRHYKRVLIEKYFKENGVKNPDYFKSVLELYQLPEWLAKRVKEFV